MKRKLRSSRRNNSRRSKRISRRRTNRSRRRTRRNNTRRIKRRSRRSTRRTRRNNTRRIKRRSRRNKIVMKGGGAPIANKVLRMNNNLEDVHASRYGKQSLDDLDL